MNTPLRKVAVAALLAGSLGLPLIESWQALWFVGTLLAVLFGDVTRDRRRFVAAAALVAIGIGVRTALPRADIAEAHNAFLVIGSGESLERALPPEVFRHWKAQFDALYPPDTVPYEPRSQWRQNGGVPRALFTASSDAIWRDAKYSRQVDAIYFTTLGEFRGGFANEVQYNFWTGELRRERMPFYAMYELTPASVGSRLAWRGEVFWEIGGGRFEWLVHDAVAEREIRPEDAGRRVYAAFFPQRDEQLYMELRPSAALRTAAWLRLFVSAGSALGVIALLVRPRWISFGRAVAIYGTAYGIMAAFLAVSLGKYLGQTYPPQGGGDDGMVHDGWGRAMAIAAGRGDILEALRGIEDVYWFTPGTRYLRMVEKLLFGDTNHLFAVLLPCVAVVMFYLVRHLAGLRWALVVTGFFCLMPVENLSFLQYVVNAKLGYGEWAGGFLFLLGFALMVRTEPAWGGGDRTLALVWVAGASLAASMFVRPNFALAVVWACAAYAVAAWRGGDLPRVAVVALGAGLALWMPFHNWYYGGEFHLISKSGDSVSLLLGPGDYLTAARHLLLGNLETKKVSAVSNQIMGWLFAYGLIMRPQLQPLAWGMHGVKLVALAATCVVAVRWIISRRRDQHALGVMAVAAMLAHLPMLFVFTTNARYAALGWDLSLLVLIVSVSRFTMRPVGHIEPSTV
jgi:hypothetical protein